MAAEDESDGLKGMIAPASTAWLRSPGIRTVFAAFEQAGLEVRAVGGAVRNHLLDMPVADVDLATPAKPDEVVALADDISLRAFPSGYAHGTVTLLANGQSFEVTTLRRDVETDGRHAVVAYGADWREDAQRRDFTINALSCTPLGTVYDYTGGLADIKARHVRFIGHARSRIREDYLRILRFFRFTASFAAGAPDAEGLAAATAERAGLAGLSAERVRGELLKLLVAPCASKVLPYMADAGILDIIVGRPTDVQSFTRIAAIEQNLGLDADPILRLAVLTANSQNESAIPKRLRLSSDEAEQYRSVIASQGDVDASSGEAARRVLLFHLGADDYRRAVLAAWAGSHHPVDDPNWRRDVLLPQRWTPPDVPVRGADILARGIPQGPLIGKIVADFTNWWKANDFSSDVTAQAAALDSLIGRHKTMKKDQK